MDEVSRKDAETQRGEERTMGQAICDSPPWSELWGRLFVSLLNPLRLGVLSEAGVN